MKSTSHNDYSPRNPKVPPSQPGYGIPRAQPLGVGIGAATAVPDCRPPTETRTALANTAGVGAGK